MLILGIDPGSMFTGFAWIREVNGEVIRFITCFKCDISLPHRYMQMGEKLEAQLDRLPAIPNLVVIERPLDLLPTEGSLHAVFRLQGGYAIVARELGRKFGTSIPLLTPTVREWMKNRPKDDVYTELCLRYNYQKFTTDDEADALGLADFGYEIKRKEYARHAVRKGAPANLPLIPQESAPRPPGGEHGDPGVAPRA